METECAIAEVIDSNEGEDVGGATVEEINMDVVTLSTDNILEEEMINPTQCKVGMNYGYFVVTSQTCRDSAVSLSSDSCFTSRFVKKTSCPATSSRYT